MKKLIFGILMLSIFASCTKDPDIWNSATTEYDGNWQFQVYSSDMSALYVDYGNQKLYTYNSANNVENELWFEDGSIFGMKFKASLTGDETNFTAGRAENISFSTSINELDPPDTSDLNETSYGDYTAIEITEGKIIEAASVANSGVATDSIYLKVICYLNLQDFTSELDGMDTTWNVFPTDSTISYDVDTTIHEYSMDTTSTYYDETGIKMNDSIYLQIDSTLVKKYTAYDSTISVIDTLYMWKTDSVIYEGTEEYIISGFRKTGYPEDE